MSRGVRLCCPTYRADSIRAALLTERGTAATVTQEPSRCTPLHPLPFTADKLINPFRSGLSRSHRQDHGSRTRDGIAACIYAFP